LIPLFFTGRELHRPCIGIEGFGLDYNLDGWVRRNKEKWIHINVCDSRFTCCLRSTAEVWGGGSTQGVGLHVRLRKGTREWDQDTTATYFNVSCRLICLLRRQNDYNFDTKIHTIIEISITSVSVSHNKIPAIITSRYQQRLTVLTVILVLGIGL